MAHRAALCLVALFSIVGAVPQNFYYQTSYQPVYQPAYKPVYQPAYQPVYQPAYQPVYHSAYQTFNPQLVPLPLAAQSFAHPYIPAVPTLSIYSGPARAGYSYETQDAAGGHGQVIYVSGPNSQQIFQQNAKTLHFAFAGFPTLLKNDSQVDVTSTDATISTDSPSSTEAPLFTDSPTSSDIPTSTEAPAPSDFPASPNFPTSAESSSSTGTGSLPPIDYIRAEVIPPQATVLFGAYPVSLFAYSVHSQQGTPKKVPATNISISTAAPTTVKSEEKEEMADDISDAATTITPSSTESDSLTTADSILDIRSESESYPSNSAPKDEAKESSKDEPEESTESSNTSS